MKCPICGKEIANGSMFCEYCGAQVKKNKKPLFVTFFIVVFALTAIILGVLYYDANQCYYWANQERWEYKNKYETAIRERDEYKTLSENANSLRKENSSLKKERDNAKSELSSLKNKVSTTYPIIITDIEIANMIQLDGDRYKLVKII